jgi:TRAP-type C4-dicarboxylate transport system permease small subunit
MAKKIWENLEEILGSIMVAVMVTIAFVNVLTRYFIKMSLSWTEEIEINLFVWLVLLGTAVAFKKGGHLGMSFVYEKFPKGCRKAFFIISVALSLVFFGVLAYLGYTEVCDEIELCVTTESLAIPVFYYTIATPLLSILVIGRLLQSAVQTLRNKEY